jgi:hypothetical protein
MDPGELVLAELADRRARLEELLRLIRMEAVRQMDSPEVAGPPACRPLFAPRERRFAGAD